jgi:hypothetical protein
LLLFDLALGVGVLQHHGLQGVGHFPKLRLQSAQEVVCGVYVAFFQVSVLALEYLSCFFLIRISQEYLNEI